MNPNHQFGSSPPSQQHRRALVICSHVVHSTRQTDVHQNLTSSGSLSPLFSELYSQFHLPIQKLIQIRDNIVREMQNGLAANKESSLKMIPTFVTQLPKGTERGSAYAVDMGGSNLRILKVTLDGYGKVVLDHQFVIKQEIPHSVQESDAEILFGYIAECIKKVVQKDSKLGFTFSFPVDQKSINSGILIKWTKGFKVAGTVDHDVVLLLNNALEKKGVNAKVNALINDTVGTLLTGCYQQVNADCCIGLILGTGANSCYWEKIENIKKYNPTVPSSAEGMIINIECGNFGSTPGHIGRDLPVNKWDLILNKESNNLDNQMLEKQISGMYLGEIVRIVLVDLIKQSKIFLTYSDNVPSKLLERHAFHTRVMSEIEIDQSKDLTFVKEILREFGILLSTWEERQFVKDVVHLIAERAAALSATQIAACLKQMGKENKDVVVAVDGSVFEKYPGFKEMMEANLEILLQHKKVKLVLAQDGSGVGAALASFVN